LDAFLISHIHINIRKMFWSSAYETGGPCGLRCHNLVVHLLNLSDYHKIQVSQLLKFLQNVGLLIRISSVSWLVSVLDSTLTHIYSVLMHICILL
jgi:hypothetical protein